MSVFLLYFIFLSNFLMRIGYAIFTMPNENPTKAPANLKEVEVAENAEYLWTYNWIGNIETRPPLKVNIICTFIVL